MPMRDRAAGRAASAPAPAAPNRASVSAPEISAATATVSAPPRVATHGVLRRLEGAREPSERSEGRVAGEGGRRLWLEWFLGQRAAPERTLPEQAIARALEHARAFNADERAGRPRIMGAKAVESASDWLSLGPSRIPNGQTDGTPLSPVSGRVSAIAVHPTNPDIVYAGGALGGVWKTTNATAASPTWIPLTDTQPSLSVGSIVIDPLDPNIIYVGTGELADYFGRGILRSIDGGTTWTRFAGGGDPATATTPFDGRAVTKLVIDPSSAGSTTTTTLFASTSMGFIDTPTGIIGPANSIFGGVYRSTDSGQTWTALNVPAGAAESAQVFDLALDPTNPNVLYAGVDSFPTLANGGIWKSVNAKAATPAFTHLSGGLPNPATASFFSLEEITLGIGGAAAHNTLYAALGDQRAFLWGLYKTTDGGTTWTHVAAANGTGTLTGTTLAVATPTFPTDGSWSGRRIILLNNYSGTIDHVVDSTHLVVADITGNGGSFAWSVGAYPPYCDGQCFFDMTVGVDPSDAAANTVYVGGNGARLFSNSGPPTVESHVWRSDNGGTLWTPISPGNGTTGGLHADDHAIAFDTTAGTFPRPVYDGNDGGIWSTTNQGASWKTLNTNITITQFQSVALHPSDTRIAIGGTQDNGTDLLNPAAQTPPAWFHSDDGDGGQTIVDQSDPMRMLHTYFNQTNNFFGPSLSLTGGTAGPGEWMFVGGDVGPNDSNGFTLSDPVSFYAPMARNAAFAPNVVYFGTNRLYRSANPQAPGPGVSSWTVKSGSLAASGSLSAIGALQTLVAGKEVVYTGSSGGQISASSNVDGTASLATFTRIDTSSAIMPPRFVSQILVDAGDATGNTAYVTFSGFNANTATKPGHVFKTVNGLNATPGWTNISGDLPDIPVNAVALDPSRSPSIIYLGTDLGVFQSVDGGTHYVYLNNGFPVVAVLGLERNPHTGQIVAATHGRGMFQLVRNLVTDVTPPTCGGSAANGTTFNGTAGDSAINDTGVATITLLGGSTNVALTSLSYSNPGSATWTVTTIDHCMPGSGTVRVTDYGGNFCDTPVSLTGEAPSAAITAPASVAAASTGNAASVPSAGAGATYAWSITNGTITSGSGTAAIIFTAGASGSVGLHVTVTNSLGCAGNGSVSIPIVVTTARVFLSPTGNDSADCANALTPCLTFAGALPQVGVGGEVIALATGGYGPLNITSSVTISGPNGVVLYSHSSVGINAPGARVVLRGLTIDGASGDGISIAAASSVFVENCVINASTGNGIVVGAGVTTDLVVQGSTIRNNGHDGVLVSGTGGGLTIQDCHVEGNASSGIEVNAGGASIVDSTVEHNGNHGISVSSGALATVRETLSTRNAASGLIVSGGGTIRVSDTTVTFNAVGLSNSSGTLASLGDNSVIDNTSNTSGSITSYPPI